MKNKAAKKRTCIAIALALLCAAFFAACGKRMSVMEQVIASFEEQKDGIMEKISEYEAGEEPDWDELEGVEEVCEEWRDFEAWQSGQLRFRCYTYGILTSGFEAGFYYSPQDLPDIVGWIRDDPAKLVEDGDGYSYEESGGDNRYYTERICEHFYYYEETN